MEKFARSTGEPRDIGRSFSHGDCNGKEKRTSSSHSPRLLPIAGGKPKLTTEIAAIQRIKEKCHGSENSRRRSFSALSRS
ncbi:hypothetical protein K0M31_008745, partial [Melipona bicolor]